MSRAGRRCFLPGLGRRRESEELIEPFLQIVHRVARRGEPLPGGEKEGEMIDGERPEGRLSRLPGHPEEDLQVFPVADLDLPGLFGQEIEDHFLRFGEAGEHLIEEGFVEAEDLPEGRFPDRPVEGEPLQEDLREGALLLRPRGKRIPSRRRFSTRAVTRALRGSAESRSRASSPSGVVRKARAIRARFSTAHTTVCGCPGEPDGDDLLPDRCHRFTRPRSRDRARSRRSAPPTRPRDEEPLLCPVEEIVRRPGGVTRRRPLELGRRAIATSASGNARPGAGRKRGPP